VGDGPVLPKFNGGPGLIHEDDRCWGWGYWWQNTRELIWPMFPANHLRYARAHLDFYDRTFPEYKQQTANSGKIGIRVWEGATPFKIGTTAPPKAISAFDPSVLEKAIANTTMENVASHYNARSMAQGAELGQQLFDYVAFTGDAEFLRNVVSPWLKEVTLFYLSYLKREADGRYHMTPSDAVEQWWRVKDPMTDMCAIRYCFWKVLHHGAQFGYEPALIEAVHERLDRLAPLPTGIWHRRAITKQEIPPGRPAYLDERVDHIERTDAQFVPAGDMFDDPFVYNMENPELYVIYPFGLVDATAPQADYERAVRTFKARKHPNWAGRFKLRARGGFLVTAEFQPGGRVERLIVESERGQTLALTNPFQQCRVLQGDRELLSTQDAVIRLPTQKGDVLEFRGRQSQNQRRIK
jgi:hypothetical protein